MISCSKTSREISYRLLKIIAESFEQAGPPKLSDAYILATDRIHENAENLVYEQLRNYFAGLRGIRYEKF